MISSRNARTACFYRPAPDSARINHAVVRSWIGDAGKGVRPKFYALESCPNIIFAHQNYAYKEEKNPEKALSEGPQFRPQGRRRRRALFLQREASSLPGDR
jgi:hypothetical protein